MEQFNLEIISPEKSFLIKNDAIEVVVPAVEGYMGILKDHIPIISFLKPGIIDVKLNNERLNFYIDDGILEFKDNTLSILTSNIFDVKDIKKNNVDKILKDAEEGLKKENIKDQDRFILEKKIEVLNSLSIN
ncbi:MAG: ATP synthase F1 subunit epsilon [Candidatus Pelagibacter sp.]